MVVLMVTAKVTKPLPVVLVFPKLLTNFRLGLLVLPPQSIELFGCK